MWKGTKEGRGPFESNDSVSEKRHKIDVSHNKSGRFEPSTGNPAAIFTIIAHVFPSKSRIQQPREPQLDSIKYLESPTAGAHRELTDRCSRIFYGGDRLDADGIGRERYLFEIYLRAGHAAADDSPAIVSVNMLVRVFVNLEYSILQICNILK